MKTRLDPISTDCEYFLGNNDIFSTFATEKYFQSKNKE